jgi:hypothetical protein
MNNEQAVVTAVDVSKAADETERVADVILGKSTLWLILHPIKLYKLRKDMLSKRKNMLTLLDEWRRTGRHV